MPDRTVFLPWFYKSYSSSLLSSHLSPDRSTLKDAGFPPVNQQRRFSGTAP